jgi:sulfur carrier protein ThiS
VDGFKMWGGGGVEGDAVDEDTNIRFYELYAILVWVAKPVTNVGTVTDPTTDRTSIPISWTNTLDSDGGGQTRYHVKVYTDAQYGAGGFDPDESTPYWDSGNTVSSATSTTTGSLVNDTYRAYVRVAQTVNGQAFWSDWDYDEFTVTVVAPEITSVTLAPDSLGVQQQGVVVTVNRDTTPDTAWNYIEVERTDVSGATWVPVRGATYVAPTGANSHVVTDYELPNGVTVKYRARATRIVSTLPLTGSWVESSTTSWTSTSLWLKAPLTPALNQTVTIREPFQTRSYASRVSVFPVIGSSTPVAIADVLQEPVQTLTIDTDTDAASSTLLTLLRETFLLYCPTACEGSTTQQYVAVTGVSMTPTVVKGKVRRRWSVTVVACDAPRDPLASAP